MIEKADRKPVLCIQKSDTTRMELYPNSKCVHLHVLDSNKRAYIITIDWKYIKDFVLDMMKHDNSN